ncbi:hypothetical protein CR513_12843, partial [Mucuna pruriens]
MWSCVRDRFGMTSCDGRTLFQHLHNNVQFNFLLFMGLFGQYGWQKTLSYFHQIGGILIVLWNLLSYSHNNGILLRVGMIIFFH